MDYSMTGCSGGIGDKVYFVKNYVANLGWHVNNAVE